jgi:hypothetical protein
MNWTELIAGIVAVSLVVTELALVIAINRTNREIRNLRADLPKLLAVVAGLTLLSEAAKRVFPPKKME